VSRKTFVTGVGMTPFTKPGVGPAYDVLGAEAARMALADAGVAYTEVQQAYVGYVYGDSTCGQRALYRLGMTGLPVFNVNNNCSTGSSALAQPVIRALRKAEEAEGREVFRKVVNISSIAGLGGNAGQANYSTAKAGVIGLTKALSKEWGRLKVNVNCVAFGLIKTRLTEAPAGTGATITVEGSEIKVGINPDLMVMLEQNIPLGRGGTPDEAAEAVYSLCTAQSNYISGQVVVCGGGISI
jgi:NAD(P)-dependent dehydrogenase (short-subunit alcohol dehydrogenase family)